jgi:hypothetical protein
MWEVYTRPSIASDLNLKSLTLSEWKFMAKNVEKMPGWTFGIGQQHLWISKI